MKFILLISLLLFTGCQQAKYVDPVFSSVPAGSVKPKGWLLNQLNVMRDGTTGHLDEIYPKIRDKNGWLGGDGDGWEETPYWLDGAVALAYLLDDKVLKEKTLKYINWIIENQRPSGYFGAITKKERGEGIQTNENTISEFGDDWWPKMIVLKIMQQYYTASGDERVIDFMTDYFHFQLKALKTCPLEHWTAWSKSRGTENILVAQWLYSITNDKSLLELADLLDSQSFPWSEWMGQRDWVINTAAYLDNENWMNQHGVNVGMGIKAPALNYQRTGDRKFLEYSKTGFTDIMTLHGLPMGIFSSDEDLHGNDPVQGAELCAIVEAMFSLEQMAGITGDILYMDALERMAFNALPTQTTDDYSARQYYQVPNQVHVKKGHFNFAQPFDKGMTNVFGMRSGYSCCLANMHQGWPKFTQHLWYKAKDNGLAALIFGPNELKTKVGKDSTEITINEITDYPFNDLIVFGFSIEKATRFGLTIRIPSWCKEAILKINDEDPFREAGGKLTLIERVWSNGDKLTVQFPMEITTSTWGKNTRTIERGPLVYALKLGERWERSTHPDEGDYFSIYPDGNWNYGFLQDALKDPSKNISVSHYNPDYDKFLWNLDNVPVELHIPAKKIPSWILVNDVAVTPVTTRKGIYMGEVNDEIETITLVPYGCTKLRIVAFPVVK